MPLPGGAANKVGNRYELLWTISQLVRILKDEAKQIHLEPIGEMGELIEFSVLLNDGTYEMHQVKRQLSGEGHWTVSDLSKAGIIRGIQLHVLKGGHEFVFISTQAPKGLPELTERANDLADTYSASDFEDTLKDNLTSVWSSFKRTLFPDDAACTSNALQVIRQCKWKTTDEEQLRDRVRSELDMILTGDPEVALCLLSDLIIASIHRPIQRTDIMSYLNGKGVLSSDWARDNILVERLDTCLENYRQSQSFDIGGLVLIRDEAAEVVQILSANVTDVKTVFLIGSAGIGKSSVTLKVMEEIGALGWTVLPIRLDHIDKTNNPALIGKQLLQMEKSPVTILASLAAGEDCLLVIEQFDTVSTVSGRNTQLFNAVDLMVREARSHSNIRLLIVGREFDLQYDTRLRGLVSDQGHRASTVSIGTLKYDSIVTALNYIGVNPESLSPTQIELLKIPLHLSLLASVVKDRDDHRVEFSSAIGLLDAFWDRKRNDLSLAGGDFESSIYSICDAMNREQSLSIPKGSLQISREEIDKLISANVLIGRGIKVNYFHESFFDYVFARHFSEQGLSLLAYLRSKEQGLFQRSQVRQILVYRRDNDPSSYIKDLSDCLNVSDVRFHIKQLIVGVVGQVSVPMDEEWDVLSRHSDDHLWEPGNIIGNTISSSPTWFRFLSGKEIVKLWLSSDQPAQVSFSYTYLHKMVSSETDLVASLLEHSASLSTRHNENILNVIARSQIAANSFSAECLFYRLLAEDPDDLQTAFTSIASMIDSYCYGTASKKMVACKAIGKWLKILQGDAGRRMVNSTEHNVNWVFSAHHLEKLTGDTSEAFVNAISEPLTSLLDFFSVGDSPPYKDKIWGQGFSGWLHSESELLLLYIVSSLKTLASQTPALYWKAIDKYRNSDSRTAHAILIRALAVGCTGLKDNVVEYLVESWRKWGIWYDHKTLWDCRCLIEKVSPSLNTSDVARLEPYLLHHYEQWQEYAGGGGVDTCHSERRKSAKWYRNQYGREQYQLLSVLPVEILSSTGRKRLAELSRKQQSLKWEIERPLTSRGGIVTSPLPEQATSKMNDSQWLLAIGTYYQENDKKWLEDRVLGGARELARALEFRTREEPERFASLLLRLPEDTHESYISAILMGLRNSALRLDLLCKVVGIAHSVKDQPHGRSIVDLIANHVTDELPNSLLEIITYYALESSDPNRELWRAEAGEGQPYYGGDPHMQGYNSVRGNAASSIAELIPLNRKYWEFFEPVIARMKSDPMISVRSCVVEICNEVLRYDRPKALLYFNELCNADDDLLATNPVEGFLFNTITHDFHAVSAIVHRMLVSPLDTVREIAARQATRAALVLEDAQPLAAIAIHGDSSSQAGAAQILSHNALTSDYSEYCCKHLAILFVSTEKDVRQKASSWIRRVQGIEQMGPMLPLVTELINSPALVDCIEDLLDVFSTIDNVPPEVPLLAIEKYLVEIDMDSEHINNRIPFHTRSLSKVLLQIYYRAADDDEIRSQCLNHFDKLILLGVPGVDEALELYNR
ncbi:MAG: hypothetical protein GY835_07970 [bacterium]|nr:hypothetical protein [bacterium]